MTGDSVPETRYARSGDVHIAYQVLGEGPVDLVCVPGWISNVEYGWTHPWVARYYRRLAAFARVITFDKRGTGLSDRIAHDEPPSLETRMDDVRAVMDAAGSERAVIYGVSEGGPMSVLFAATYPGRTVALVGYGCSPRDAWAPDFPWGYTREELEKELDDTVRRWGSIEFTAQILREWGAPSVADDTEFVRWLAPYSRMSASPAAAAALSRMNFDIDVRHVLPTIQVPTLILHREGDGPEVARYMADRIRGAKCVVLPGPHHLAWVDEKGEIVAEIERFVRDVRDEEAEFDRVLATVLFTDIVGSTERVTHLGDRRWRELLEDHNTRVRGLLTRYRGREIDTAGDGFLATFDGPARAIRCARAASLAGPGEVLVSSTVKDLVACSGLQFEDRGSHELKGIPGRWQLFAAVDAVG